MKAIEMMNRAKFIKQGSKMVLVIDLSELESEDAHKVIKRGEDIIRRMPKNSVLTLANLENTRQDDELEKRTMELLKHNKPHVLKAAVAGIAGKSFQAYRNQLSCAENASVESFRNIEDALGWLVHPEAA